MYALFVLFAVSLISCKQDEPKSPQDTTKQENQQESNDSQNASIVGHWDLNYLLVNTIEDMDMQQEKVFYPGSMDVYENHTLMFGLYDPSSKNWGQWIQNGNQFIVSLEVEDGYVMKQSFKIQKLTKTELVLIRSIFREDNIEIGTYDYYCIRK